MDNWNVGEYNPHPRASKTAGRGGLVSSNGEGRPNQTKSRPRPVHRMHANLLPPAWALCLSAFERELTPQQFATWIRPLSCADEGGTLKLLAPNRFVLQWVRDRFSSRGLVRVCGA